jgi:hypothetical protein
MIFKKLTVVLLAMAWTNAVFAKDSLAIMPFTGGAAGDGETVAELFSYNPELTAEFTLIPRTSIAGAITSEQTFQTTGGMTDPDNIAKLGVALGAQYMVTGNIGTLGNRNLLTISIWKIDDLRQIAGDIQTYTNTREIRDNLPGMARNIIAATKIDVSQLDKLAVTPVQLGRDVDVQTADTLAQVLSIYLIRTQKYAVYPRTATLEQVQREYDNQTSGMTADENIVGIGKGENPRLVLSVAARHLDDLNMFNASIINMESGAQLIGTSEEYQTLSDGITAMENLARKLTGTTASSGGAGTTGVSGLDRIRADADAAANKAPSKPPRKQQSGFAVAGYMLLNVYVLGLGSLIQGDLTGFAVTFLSYGAAAGLIAWDVSLDYDNELAGIPGGVGFGIAGFAAIYGLVRPIVVNNNRALAEIIDRVDIALVPQWDGRKAVQLAYTVKF